MRPLMLIWLAVSAASCAEEPRQNEDHWTYPVRLGDTRQAVQGQLGIPSTVMSNGAIEWYPTSGVSVKYDSYDRAGQLGFKGNHGHAGWITSEAPIVSGTRATMDREQLVGQLGEPHAIQTSEAEYGWHTLLWRISPYVVQADVWIRDVTERGTLYKAHSLKWLTIWRGI